MAARRRGIDFIASRIESQGGFMLQQSFFVATGVSEDPPFGRMRFGEIRLECEGALRRRPT